MPDIKNIRLVSSEISGLWDGYFSDSIAVCTLSHFLNNVQDKEIKVLLQQTLDLSKKHMSIIADILNQEGIPIPQGFTEKDVNINAPRLFTDTFYAAYVTFMARIGMHNYTLILNQIAHSDIRDYFSKCIIECIDLYNKSTELRLSKGIFIRAPHIEVPKKVEFVKDKSFMLDIFEGKRSLLAREITHLFELIFTNILGDAISTGFGQVCKNKKASDYFFEGKHFSEEVVKELTMVLMDEDIPIPSTSENFVTDSTEPPFSDKLMLNHIIMMTTVGISSKGMAISQSVRSDLQAKYVKLIGKIMKYAKNGVDIMIENGYLEQPPQAINHEKLD